jgi:ABC-2 type transport system permease protein
MRTLFAIACKDLRLLVRDWASAFFTFGFPLIVAVFFGMVFGGAGGGGRPASLAVVDESGGPLAASFIADLDADPILEAVPAATRAEGEQLVRAGKALACVVLPKEFDASAQSIFAGGSMRIEAVVDPVRRAETGLLTGKLNELAFRQMAKSFGDPERMRSMMTVARGAIALSPSMPRSDKDLFRAFFDSAERLTTERTGGADGGAQAGPMTGFAPATVEIVELRSRRADGPSNAYAISFPQGIAWGLMGCVMTFGSGLAQERTRGTLLRLAIAPVARWQVLVGKALGCFLACLALVVGMIVFGRIALGVTIAAPWLFVLAATTSAFGFSGLMMLLAGVFRTEGAAEGAGRACILVLAMIGGGTIPLFFMPGFLQTMSMVSPFRWAIFAIEGAIWRDLGFVELLPSLGMLVAFGVVGFAVGAIAFRNAEAR